MLEGDRGCTLIKHNTSPVDGAVGTLPSLLDKQFPWVLMLFNCVLQWYTNQDIHASDIQIFQCIE